MFKKIISKIKKNKETKKQNQEEDCPMCKIDPEVLKKIKKQESKN